MQGSYGADVRTCCLTQGRHAKTAGAFLRARRENLDPQRLGLPRSGRRRTPGLRREEVALLADVGVRTRGWSRAEMLIPPAP